MALPKALIFDLNGTMVDDMKYHIRAWSDLLNNELSANLSPDEVRSQMYGKNSELLIRVFGPGRFTEEEMDRLSIQKEERYQQAFLPDLRLIPGLAEFLEKAAAKNIPMAIGSAAIPFNIDFVLDRLKIRHYFKAVVSAEDVAVSKPHPETFLRAAALLGVDAPDCIVFEDAPKGVEAALNAGMPAVVLTTLHSRNEFIKYSNTLQFIKDYTDPFLDQLL
jgi:beta-phosphoglucomutase